VLYTWQWLHEAVMYHDHHYLTSVLAFALLVTNAHHFGAVFGPSGRVRPIPYWNVLLFKSLVASVYFWSGVSKVNQDWVRGYPIYTWIPYAIDPTVKYALALLSSWVLMTFEILVPFWLSFRVLRPWAIAGCHVYQTLVSLFLFPTPCPLLLHTPSVLFLETHTVRHALLGFLTRRGARLNPRGSLFRFLRGLHRRIPYYIDENLSARFILESAKQKDKEEGEEKRPIKDEVVTSPGAASTDGDASSPKSRRSNARRRRGEKKPHGDGNNDTAAHDRAKSPTKEPNNDSAAHKKRAAGHEKPKPPPVLPASAQPGRWRRRGIVAFLLLFLALQSLLPLRPYVLQQIAQLTRDDLPGTLGPSWTENGHPYSWRGMLLDKQCGGFVTVKTGPPYLEVSLQNPCRRGVHPLTLNYLQCHGVLQRPSMIRQHAVMLREYYTRLWNRDDIRLYVDLRCTLNGAPIQQYTFRRMDVVSLPAESFINLTLPEPFIGPQQSYAGGRKYIA